MAKLPGLKDQLHTLIGLPSISSCSPDFDQSNRAVIDQLAEWLNELGFQCQVLSLSTNPQKANLVATLGSGPGGLVLSGHTDTVPYDQGQWQSDPFKLTEREQRFYGLGSSDMKSFFALAIEAIRQLDGASLKRPLILLATADEESSMQGARDLATYGGPNARYAIIGEPTSLQPIRMHKGFLSDKLTVHGRSAHSSNPALGSSAIDAMHEVIAELLSFRRQLVSNYQRADFEVDIPTMNLGCLHGGDNPNRICNSCELQFDLRCLPEMSNAELRANIAGRIEQVARRTQTTIDYEPLQLGTEPFEQAADSEIVRVAEQLTGQAAGNVAFATEAPFLQQMGMETIVLGPGSINQAHQPDEYIELQQIKPCVTLLGRFIEHFCVKP